jgi:hypothetical protein
LAAGVLAGCGSTSTSVAPSSTSSDKCALTLTTSTQTVDASGGQGKLSVSVGRECSWSASSSVPWITFRSPAQGQGDGAVDFAVAANSDPSPRAGTVTVVERQVSISQRAGTCEYRLSLNSSVVPSRGARRDIEVRASSSACEWTAASQANWIAITAGASGKGDGRVTFEVAATTGPPRSGSLTVAGHPVAVTQAEGCTFTVSPTALSVSASRETATIRVSGAAGCPWSAGSPVDWIAISEGTASGAGSGSVQLSVAANDGPARSADITIADRPVRVQQAAGCTFQVSPAALSFIYQGQARDVLVTSSTPGCAWTAESHSEWLSVAPASASGTGTASVQATRNGGPARTGTVVIAGHTVSATQVSGCDHEFSAEGARFGSRGGEGKFRVIVSEGCVWQARVVGGSWVRITRGDDGNGNGTVEFKVSANWGSARTAQIVVENKPFTITQSGR